MSKLESMSPENPSGPMKLAMVAKLMPATFSASDLVVKAHAMHPELFSLKGYPTIPGENRVLSYLMGERGLVRKGFIERLGPCTYRYCAEDEEQELEEPAKKEQPVQTIERSKPLNNRNQPFGASHILIQALNTAPMQNMGQHITFVDACAFWGIPRNSDSDNAEKEKHRFERALAKGKCLDKETLLKLREVNQELNRRFARHLKLLFRQSA